MIKAVKGREKGQSLFLLSFSTILKQQRFCSLKQSVGLFSLVITLQPSKVACSTGGGSISCTVDCHEQIKCFFAICKFYTIFFLVLSESLHTIRNTTGHSTSSMTFVLLSLSLCLSFSACIRVYVLVDHVVIIIN